MKGFKKLIVLPVLVVLVGCGEKNSNPEQQTQPTNSVQSKTNKLATFVNPKPRTNFNIKITPVPKSSASTKDQTKEPSATKMITNVSITPAVSPSQTAAPANVNYTDEKVEDLKIKASNGDTAAQLELASRYLYGRGVDKDEVQAIQWLALAAQSGSAVAQNRLGLIYATGQAGVQKDPTQAVYWYKMAAEQDFVTAQNNLGIMYAQGNGVEKDDIEAYKWLTLAGKRLTNAMMFRKTIEQRMTPEQIQEANRRITEYLSNNAQRRPQ